MPGSLANVAYAWRGFRWLRVCIVQSRAGLSLFSNRPAAVYFQNFVILFLLVYCMIWKCTANNILARFCKPKQGVSDMKATGIVRRIDDLGRVVIPKEIRRTLRIREGDPSLTTLKNWQKFCFAMLDLAKRMGWD